MIWYVMAILAVVVLGGVAAAAAGLGGTMPEAFDDRVDSRLPLGRVAETDVQAVRLPVALRGYRMEEVDQLLDILGAQIAEQQTTIEELRSQGIQQESAAPTPSEVEAMYRPESDVEGD